MYYFTVSRELESLLLLQLIWIDPAQHDPSCDFGTSIESLFFFFTLKNKTKIDKFRTEI